MPIRVGRTPTPSSAIIVCMSEFLEFFRNEMDEMSGGIASNVRPRDIDLNRQPTPEPAAGNGNEAGPISMDGETIDLNKTPKIFDEQVIILNDQVVTTIQLNQEELTHIMSSLPKEELKQIIGDNSIRQPIENFSPQQQEELRELAISHFRTIKFLRK